MKPVTRIFIAAVIVADAVALVYFGGNLITTGKFLPHEQEPEIVVAAVKEAMEAAAAPTEVTDAAEQVAAADEPFVADPIKGKSVSAKCKACHTFDNGGKNMTGPNLWGIYGVSIAHLADFSYSDAFQAKKGAITWDDESLNAYLKNPREYIPGNKMAFAGISNDKDRANLIAYLKTLTE